MIVSETVAGESAESNTTVTLYRGMKGMKLQDNFLQQGKGDTELAPMWTSRASRWRDAVLGLGELAAAAAAHKIFMVRGPEITFLSAFPGEKESFLFPPLTYLEPTGETQTLRVDDAHLHRHGRAATAVTRAPMLVCRADRSDAVDVLPPIEYCIPGGHSGPSRF